MANAKSTHHAGHKAAPVLMPTFSATVGDVAPVVLGLDLPKLGEPVENAHLL